MPPLRSHQRERRAEFARRLAPLRVDLVAFARRLSPRGVEAEDVLQSALTSAWQRFRQGEEIADFRAWMARFVLHEAANQRRRRDRAADRAGPLATEIEADDPAGELVLELAYDQLAGDPVRFREQLGARLNGALASLSDSEREALLLRAMLELPCERIAEIQAVPRGTVFARLSRARHKLRLAVLAEPEVAR